MFKIIKLALLVSGLLLSLAQALRPPGLFDTDWSDRSPFLLDLQPYWHNSLTDLQTAAVYHLELVLCEDASLQGRLELLISNNSAEAWNDVVLHLHPNSLGSDLSVRDIRVDGETVVSFLLESRRLLRVELPEALGTGDSLVLSLRFNLQVPETLAAYGRLSDFPQILSLAHAYPTLARYANGQWQTSYPPLKADPLVADSSFYLLRLRLPADYQVAASGRLIALEHLDDWQELTYAAGPARDFYVAIFQDYQQLSKATDKLLIHSYAPQLLQAALPRSLEIAERALNFFSEVFVPYPYREFDMVAVPVNAGGIEHPGIVNLAVSLYGQRGASLEPVIVHEVAHQWSYNLVGSDQVLEPWLDEALAQYLTLMYFREFGNQSEVTAYLDFWQRLWLSTPDTDKPIGLAADAYNDLAYSGIVYGRGLFFFEALAEQIGRELLHDALRQLYQDYAWGFITTAEFQVLLEGNCHCSLDDLFTEWVSGGSSLQDKP